MAEQQDLLKSTLVFKKFGDQQNQFPIFNLVKDGKITAINEYIQELQSQGNTDEILSIVNSRDQEGKTPLQYACHYNYSNLVMYLLMKGADPYLPSNSGKNSFHILCFMGHLRCAQLIVNHERHLDRLELFQTIKQEMNNFKIKKSDVKLGQLISPDRHIRAVQQRFLGFQDVIQNLYRTSLNNLLEKFKKTLGILDELNRNPIHYASINKFTKCCATSQFLLNFGLNITGYDDFQELYDEVQLLELNKEKRTDTRQYLSAYDMCMNFLTPAVYNKITKQFTTALKKLKKEIINEQDNDGYTPLHLASFNGDFAQVQYLLKIGGNAKTQDHKHNKEVLDFAESNQVRKYLIDLKDAARKGDQKSMNLLVNCGYDLNEKKTIFGVTPLHTSIENYHKTKDDKALNYVIKCNADIDICDSNGWTGLHHAAKNGDLQVCKELCENRYNRANVNKFSNKGYYPLHIAAMFDNYEIIEYLIQNGANIEAQDNQKCTALILAAKKGNIKSVEYLINLGANLYASEIRKWTALHYAAFNYHSKVVNLLLKYDADTEKLREMKNNKEQKALQLITNSEVKFAFHTLWYAASTGNLDIVRKLTMLGYDVNEQTKLRQSTPLMFATVHEHYLVVQYLLQNGADPEIQDSQGKSAKDYSYDTNNRNLIQLFEDPGLEDIQENEEM